MRIKGKKGNGGERGIGEEARLEGVRQGSWRRSEIRGSEAGELAKKRVQGRVGEEGRLEGGAGRRRWEGERGGPATRGE